MRHPGFGEANLGAVAGAVVASICGLFAVDVPSAILSRNLGLLFSTPILAFLCWLVCLPAGWLIGGQVGPRIGESLNSQRAEIIAGGLSGLIPAALIGLWGWYMVTPH